MSAVALELEIPPLNPETWKGATADKYWQRDKKGRAMRHRGKLCGERRGQQETKLNLKGAYSY